MPKDVIVVVNLDAKPNPSEALDILILSTAGAKDPAIYRSIEEVAEDYPNSGDTAKIYRKVSALFEQGKTTLADTLIRKVKIAGVAPPTGQDDGEKAEALITAIETLRQTDDDWYMLLTDQVSFFQISVYSYQYLLFNTYMESKAWFTNPRSLSSSISTTLSS